MKRSCISCMQGFLLVINFFILLTLYIIGLGLLGIGTYLYLDPNMQAYLQSIGHDTFTGYFNFGLIGLGALTLIVALIGCFGSYHESECLLGTYFSLLLLVFSVQIGSSIFIHVQMPWLTQDVHKALQLGLLRGTVGKVQYMDLIERRYMCCGVKESGDYKSNIPLSCCNLNTDCNQPRIERPHEKGCLDIYMKAFENLLNWICLLSGCVAVIELFALLFGLIMCCSLRQDYYYQYDIVDHQPMVGYFD